MNPRDDTPSLHVDQINAEDDPVLQAIEAIEARESDLEPKPIVTPVAPRPVKPVAAPAPVVKPAIITVKPVITPIKPVVAPIKPPVAPVIAPIKPIVAAAKPVVVIAAPKPVPMTPSSRMAAELEKAPPLNTAKLILQFFGRHAPSKKPVIIIVSVVLVAALIAAGYFVWHSL